VVIDLLTGRVHLVPSRQDYRAKDIAELVFAEVYRLHGLPKRIVSDRDILFTSLFWKHLNKLMGITLNMSSAYYPKSDGSTERANHTVTQMIRACVNPDQRDWVTKLPAIEFAINSARSESTGYAPFFLDTGRMPRSMIWDQPARDEYPGVRAFAQKMRDTIMSAHDAILHARVKQTRHANQKRRPLPFSIGDMVYVSTKNISFLKGRARKLLPKYVGPYQIGKDFGNNSYRLELPARLLQQGVHPVFHASLLRVHVPNDDRLFPGRSETQLADFGEEASEWAVDQILAHKGRGVAAIFEVQWKAGDRTWLPLDKVDGLEQLKLYLDAQGVSSVAELSDGKGSPPLDDPQIFLGGISLEQPSLDSRAGGHVQKPSKTRLKDLPTRTQKTRPTCYRSRTHRRRTRIMSSSEPEDTGGHPSAMSEAAKDAYISTLTEDDQDHLIIIAGGVAFDPRTLEFCVRRFPLPAAGCTYISIHHCAMARFLDFDRGIRDGSITINDPIPTGYDEARTYLGYIFMDDEGGLASIDHDISQENETRVSIPGPGLQTTLFSQDVAQAIHASSKEKKRRETRAGGDKGRSMNNHSHDDALIASGSKRKAPHDRDDRAADALSSMVDTDTILYALASTTRAKMRQEARWKENKAKKAKTME
jgi:hypothetical protein